VSKNGKKSDRRPAFELHELKALLGNLEPWIDAARNAASRERRLIMRDYIEMLVDTGARPGIELLDIKWKQIRFMLSPASTMTDQVDEQGNPIEVHNLNRSCELTVTGKTGTRQIIGRQPTVKVLERIAKRNYGIESALTDPLKDLITPTNEDYVFRTKDLKEDVSESFQKMFMCFLEDHNLLMDPKTEQKRVFYSLRHTYAKQMGTSVVMIERHYSHLKVIQAAEQLRGAETRRLIETDAKVGDSYKSKRRSNLMKS
jgi:integrase